MDNEPGFIPILTPTAGVDPATALAMSMHAAPGVYAALIGSGVSRAAGIPTGWEVVQDLIQRVARAEGVAPSDVTPSPEEWWKRSGRPEPRYDTLIQTLAPTDAARQALLSGYFDAPPDRQAHVEPTAAHAALAELVADGRVRVILTTNFDRLMERALDTVGVSAQIISDPSLVRSMKPLVHARATVVKLHGDYASKWLKNTPEELATYPPAWRGLLTRILDEYGLVIVGWSGEHDTALEKALLQSRPRRYPLYWAAHRGHLSEAARRIVDFRGAAPISVGSADDFLCNLRDQIRHLDQRSRRSSLPLVQGIYNHSPHQTSPPQGWAVQPLLWLRTTGSLQPATLDTVGAIRPEHRDLLTEALRKSPITGRLWQLAGRTKPTSARADDGQPTNGPAVTGAWLPTPDSYQSTTLASYRLGHDAESGVGALFTAQMPSYPVGGQVLFILDIGVSITTRLTIDAVAEILRDGLMATAADVPAALVDLAPDAAVSHAEGHLISPSISTQDRMRNNSLDLRIDFTPFGQPSRPLTTGLGAGARLSVGDT